MKSSSVPGSVSATRDIKVGTFEIAAAPDLKQAHAVVEQHGQYAGVDFSRQHARVIVVAAQGGLAPRRQLVAASEQLGNICRRR